MSISENGLRRDDMDDEALDWTLRLAEPDADWDAFTTWLEADPARAARYDAVAAGLADVTAVVARHGPPKVPVANDVGPPVTVQTLRGAARRSWLGGALAASVAVAAGLGFWYASDGRRIVETRPGEQRTIALADGSSIVLSGGSRVEIDPDSPRAAKVASGEMLFIVRHDAAAPFRVSVGELDLVDLGTVFNVRMAGAETRVAVAEGAVMVDRGGAGMRLDPGQAAVLDGGALRRERQDVQDIGAWRRGRLTFDDATIADVAAELSRTLGLRITAAPAVRSRSFNGTLDVSGSGRDPALLAALLDVRVERHGDDWVLDARR